MRLFLILFFVPLSVYSEPINREAIQILAIATYDCRKLLGNEARITPCVKELYESKRLELERRRKMERLLLEIAITNMMNPPAARALEEQNQILRDIESNTDPLNPFRYNHFHRSRY